MKKTLNVFAVILLIIPLLLTESKAQSKKIEGEFIHAVYFWLKILTAKRIVRLLKSH